ncbi:hypothetical protein [Pleurocapsa sp. PCC 7319]|uniref:hypothetical protein n=1 Tax=Pleurocapsa sp. PCC 7319 TaxID=118161 RepID=UPI0003499B21|nr:hypothetical protein [Pleurocapsa sp. PCC 7319]
MPLDKAYSTSTIKAAKKISFLAIAYFIIVTFSACSNSSEIKIDRSSLVDVATITENIDLFVGKSVLVRNDVLETIGEKGLILDKDRAFSGASILVIDTSQTPLTFATEKTPEVLVSGKIERLSFTDIKQKYDLHLDPNLYTQYENQPVIIADSLTLSPDPEDLTRSPEVYYGKPLAIKGELEDLKSYGVFELDEEQVFGGEDLLVVQLKPRIKLDNEQTAIVYGTLRPFIAVELERDYDLGWDLSIQKQIEANYSQKPVLIAEKIQILKL